MQHRWLYKQNNKHCILFFNGWGMDKNAVKHLKADGFDVCMFHNYSETNPGIEEFESYDKIYVVAWSLGVWVATRMLRNAEFKIERSIAINGTEEPLHDAFGIPPAIFKGTLKRWNEMNRVKFNQRVFGGRSIFENSTDKLPDRSCEDQQKELAFLIHEIENAGKSTIDWDVALIGKADMIFQEVNQTNYWEGKTKIIKQDIPHYPFGTFKSWSEIIEL